MKMNLFTLLCLLGAAIFLVGSCVAHKRRVSEKKIERVEREQKLQDIERRIDELERKAGVRD